MKRPCPGPARFSALNCAPTLAAGALLSVLALSGCQVMSPMQTSEAYQPADGVAVDLGDVQIRDLLVIAAAKGEVGVLSGMVVNKGTEPVTITFSTGAADGVARTEIPAGRQSRLSGVDGTAPVLLPGIAAAPGGIIRLTVGTPTGGSPQVSVPVMKPDGYYAQITAPPSPSPAVPPSVPPSPATTAP